MIVLPGASGKAPRASFFEAASDGRCPVLTMTYPGWRRYAEAGFAPPALIDDLAAKVTEFVPSGRLVIAGVSIGGHFGYALALRLEAMARELAGVCAIDTFMIDSASPSVGWQRRAWEQARKMFSERRFRDLLRLIHSKFWRAAMRAGGARLPGLLERYTVLGASVAGEGSMFEEELSMRSLIRLVAPWVASLDVDPIPLTVPFALIRGASTALDDVAWRRRCPHAVVHEVAGDHFTMWDAENIDALRRTFSDVINPWVPRS